VMQCTAAKFRVSASDVGEQFVLAAYRTPANGCDCTVPSTAIPSVPYILSRLTGASVFMFGK
jgi:hypothetical protein